jgi:replicative DNA helicase
MNESFYDHAAEDALLGCIILHPDNYTEASCIVTKDSFDDTANQLIWDAISKLISDRAHLDVVTLASTLGDNLDICGGHTHLFNLIAAPYSSVSAMPYAEIVADKYNRRRIRQFAESLVLQVSDGQPVDGILFHTKETLEKIQSGKQTTVTLTDQLSHVYDLAEERAKNPNPIWGIDTGWKGINDITGGWQRGELTILAGLPGVGKSFIGGQSASYITNSGGCAVIYSLEMDASQYLKRIISFSSGIDTWKINSGMEMDQNWDAFIAASSAISKQNLYIRDDASWTTAQIRSDLYQLLRKHPVDFVVVDFMGMCADEADTEWDREEKVSTRLKRIARECKVPILGISSVKKEGMHNGRSPDMSDTSGTGKKIHVCDNLIFATPYIEETGGRSSCENMVTLTYKKHRDGIPGKINLVRIQGTGGFKEEGTILPPIKKVDKPWQSRIDM